MQGVRRTEFRIGAFPLAIVGMVVIMILPLPAAILDCLIMLNITLGVLLLISVVHSEESEQFTALPTILLLSTLFRLGLNVSTTRQLLAEGEAPAAIAAFGTFVVHGNIVVGVVLFAIITLVQYLVIAKGSERVAEVAARFALDAMPGKQMSIDADVRSGMLSLQEAKARRIELQRESKLYGALDGAMKFVKGDAIAGLCITLVNVLGGLFVGLRQQGLGVTEALSRYSVFAIGDGLASQIPALFVSVAAGVAVTRVRGEGSPTLSEDIAEQLVANPRAVASSALVVAALGCMPGLPGLPFWLMSVLLLILAYHSQSSVVRAEVQHSREAFRPMVVPGVLLQLSAAAASRLQVAGSLPTEAQKLRSRLFSELGLFVHDPQFELVAEWTSVEVAIRFQQEKVAERVFPEVAEAGAESIQKWIVDTVEHFIRTRPAEMLDDSVVRILFELHRATTEDIINSLVPSKLSVTEVTEVLKGLLCEGVSIRNLGRILQALAETEYLEKVPVAVETKLSGIREARYSQRLRHVRVALRRQIIGDIKAQRPVYPVLVAADLDEQVAQLAAVHTAPDPQFAEVLENGIRTLCETIGSEKQVLVVGSPQARSILRELILCTEFRVPVVSCEEASDAADLQIQATIGFDGVHPHKLSEPSVFGKEYDARQEATL